MAVPWGRGPFTYTPETIAFVAEKLSGRGEERVVGGPGYNNYFSSQSRMSKALSKEGVEVSCACFKCWKRAGESTLRMQEGLFSPQGA